MWCEENPSLCTRNTCVIFLASLLVCCTWTSLYGWVHIRDKITWSEILYIWRRDFIKIHVSKCATTTSPHPCRHMSSTEPSQSRYRSKLKKLYVWLSTSSKQLKCNKLLNSVVLQWMSYSTYAGIERLHQIQTAWFDYRRTITIKVDSFLLKKAHFLQKLWFNLKRKRDIKPLNRLKNWASMKSVSSRHLL